MNGFATGVIVISGGFGAVGVDTGVSVGMKAAVGETWLVSIGGTRILARVCVGVITHVALGDGDAEGLAVGGGTGSAALGLPLLKR